jgi:hypothetical protein
MVEGTRPLRTWLPIVSIRFLFYHAHDFRRGVGPLFRDADGRNGLARCPGNLTMLQGTLKGFLTKARLFSVLLNHLAAMNAVVMVRLVFRPYTQVRKAICTSAHLRASTRVSSGFALLRHSSPSFGSQQVCSYSNLSQKIMVGRWCGHRPSHQSGYLRFMGFPPTNSHTC